MTTNQKPTLKHFAIKGVFFHTTPESQIAIPPFNYSQAGAIGLYSSGITGIEDVAVQVMRVCEAMTNRETDLAVLKEVCLICHHYDKANKIDWHNTTVMIQLQLARLNYKATTINEFVDQLRLMTENYTESVFK